MNLKNITNIELTNRLNKLVRTERKITHLILEHIVEFECRKLYAEQGYNSMFSYLTKSLGYGENSAYRRLQAARLLKQVPEVATKIEDGALNLTQLTQVQKCLKLEKHQGIVRSSEETHQILEKIENCNSFETQKILSFEFNQPLQVQTRIQPQKDESIRLEATLTKEQFAELKTAQSLLSHICHSGDLGEVIATLALKFNVSKLGKKVPVNKIQLKDLADVAAAPIVQSENQIVIQNKPITQSFTASMSKTKRKYISIKTTRSLLGQADHSCDHKSSNGQRCGSQYQLQIDHRKPLALGGTNETNNLRTLCRTHNNLEARYQGLQ